MWKLKALSSAGQRRRNLEKCRRRARSVAREGDDPSATFFRRHSLWRGNIITRKRDARGTDQLIKYTVTTVAIGRAEITIETRLAVAEKASRRFDLAFILLVKLFSRPLGLYWPHKTETSTHVGNCRKRLSVVRKRKRKEYSWSESAEMFLIELVMRLFHRMISEYTYWISVRTLPSIYCFRHFSLIWIGG